MLTENYLGEIRAFSFNYAPEGWMICDGSLLTISQYGALYTLLGITFGGDGRNNFAIPDLRGRTMINIGQGPGVTYYKRGDKGGMEKVTLTKANMPAHTHTFHAENALGDAAIKTNILAIPNSPYDDIYTYNPNISQNTVLNSLTLDNTGGDQGHNNLQPYLTINFCIAVQGEYPPRP